MGTVNQAVYKAKKEQDDEDLPDLKDKDVADATLKIQSAFRGYQSRKEKGSLLSSKTKTKSRQKVKKGNQIVDDLPDLKDKDVQDAAVKIQAAFKGHRTRMSVNQAVFKAKKQQDDEDL